MHLEREQLLQIINVLERGADEKTHASNIGMPQSEEEVLNFLDRTSLENQPTEVLVHLAEKLKDRRNKIYPSDVLLTDNSYEKDLFNEKDKMSGEGSQE